MLSCRWEQLRNAQELLRQRQKSAAKKTASTRESPAQASAPAANNLEFRLQDSLPLAQNQKPQRKDNPAQVFAKLDKLASLAPHRSSFEALNLKSDRLVGDAVDVADSEDKVSLEASEAKQQKQSEQEKQGQAPALLLEEPVERASGEQKAEPVRTATFAYLYQDALNRLRVIALMT